jgi:hypothetical protein
VIALTSASVDACADCVSLRATFMSSSRLAKTEMWSGHPLLRREGRCRVARRMELGVELVRHLRDRG